jgi:DNA-binding NarL/FixJ family response regulator
MKSHSFKIIIADDSILLRDRLKTMATEFPNVVVVGEAENGMVALQLVHELNPDLIILDIRMPELNGIEVLKKIKESRRRTKVCMLTNYPFPQYKKRCLDEGADYFFDKNQDFQRLPGMFADLILESQGKNFA